MTTVVEKAITTFAVDDNEWAQLAPFMPVKERAAGPETNWRSTLNVLIVKWNLPNCAWAKIPHASRIRMAWHRSVDAGTWTAIEKALPTLKVRKDMIATICAAALQTSVLGE